MSDARDRGRARPAQRPSALGDLLAQSATLNSRMANIGLADWRRAVGARLAERTQPERVTDGILTVRVPSSTWAQELSMLSETVLERLREAGHAVERLRFHVAPTANTAVAPVFHVSRSALPDSLARTISCLDDPELRLALGDAAAYSLGRKT